MLIAQTGTDIYLSSIPSIAENLNSSLSHIQYTFSIFLLGFAISQLFYGPMSDFTGRKPCALFGLGFYSAGLFHVFTHAFFKAMLFMGAGGIIIALHHKQNIFEIAQHRAQLPIIKFTFLIGVIAISGIPFFSGFFSKDAILAAAFQEGQYLIWLIALGTAFLTF